MYGCTGMQCIAEICNSEDLHPQQQLIGITWSAATKCQCRKWVLDTNYLLHFTLSPPRLPQSFWSLPFALLSWSGSAVGWSCSPGSAQTLPPGEPEIKSHRRSLFVLFPQKGAFLQVFNQFTQCMALLVVQMVQRKQHCLEKVKWKLWKCLPTIKHRLIFL